MKKIVNSKKRKNKRRIRNGRAYRRKGGIICIFLRYGYFVYLPVLSCRNI